MRVIKDGDRPESIVSKGYLVNNFNPQEVVRFPDVAENVAYESLMADGEYESLSRADKQKCRPTILQIPGVEGPVKALAIGEKFAIISLFVADCQQGTFPMSSPHGNHIYLDARDYVTAKFHREFKEALRND